jgi:hypothetical protein
MSRKQGQVVLTSNEMLMPGTFDRTVYTTGKRNTIKVPVSMGWQKAFLHRQKLPMLKRIALFLLQEQVVQIPELYGDLDKMKDGDGSMSREILLNNLFHESDAVIDMAYEIINRVQYEEVLEAKKKRYAKDLATLSKSGAKSKNETSASVNDDGDNTDSIHGGATPTSLDAEPHQVTYTRTLDRLRAEARMNSKLEGKSEFVKLPDVGRLRQRVVLHGKVSAQGNDPSVYVTYPSRIVNGAWDHSLNDVQPLCGPSITNFFAKTAKATGAEMFQNEEDRFALASARREICMYDATDIDVDALIRQRLDEEYYNKPMPDNEALADAAVKAAMEKHEREAKELAALTEAYQKTLPPKEDKDKDKDKDKSESASNDKEPQQQRDQ